jgi:amino acid adenylation domain-containing protein
MSDSNDLHGIAIVGMAGRFPRAKDLSELWKNLRDGVDCVSYFEDDDLDPAPSPEMLRDPSFVKARGVLEDVDLFDAGFFEIPPRQAELMDPQNRLFLETAWHALEDAGYDPERVAGTIGVFGGVTLSTYFLNNLLSNPELLAAVGGYQVALGTDRDYLTTLASYKLNLRGPSIDVQTACSTSLVATALACQSLLAYGCDMALAGGVSVKVPQKSGYHYKPGGLDSAQGRCRAFDASADGSVYGGGVGVVVLKRLEDALEDGDAIYSVILGSAMNNDGSARVGFTAPGVEGQAEAIAQAQALAGVDPATIGYIECHGTGTALGDPIEVAALTKAFRAGAQGELPEGYCTLGSIKTNIGHCSAAAGVAGLIKASLALVHRQIPPTLHFERPNPAIGFAGSPFTVSASLTDWETDDAPRRAGVSSFGLGGTNAHVVLEEAPEPDPSGPSRPWQLLLVSARSEAALEAATDNLAADLESHPGRPLADVAFTLQVGRRAFPHRRVLVARDTEEARQALAGRDPRRLLGDVQEAGRRPIAFLFPGVGDHYAGMARGLYESELAFRETLDRCCELLAPRLGRDLRPLILAERAAASGAAGPDLRSLLGRAEASEPAERPLDRTLYAQPAVFAVEYAMARLLLEWGLRPEAMLGYSLGEYVAACLAEVMSLEDALALVAERSRLIDGLSPGAMLAVPLPEDRVRSLIGGSGLDLAAVNGPAVCVVAGAPGAIEALKERLAGEGVPSRRLPTTHAFHSHRMEPIAPALSRLARGLRLSAPKIPYVSNVTGTWITAKEATDPEHWARHLCQPVRFGDGLAALWQNPDRVLLEVGPGFGLSTLALQLPAEDGAERVALPSLPNEHDPQPDEAFLLGTLGKLWLAGVEVNWAGFYAHERRRRVRLPLYPFERTRYWIEARPFSLQPREEGVEASPEPPAPLAGRHVRPRLRNAWVPPETDTEKAIAGLFGELLGIEGVGLHDSFFELGGHSLLGTSLLSRLRSLYRVELPLSALFEEPTTAGLAARVEAGTGPDLLAPPPLVPVPRDCEIPLSFAQQRLWFLDRLMPGNPFYNLSGGVLLAGRLDVEALRRSVQEVVRRHETLRTAFEEVDGRPVQRIVPDLNLEIPVLDLSDLSPEEREAAARRIASEQARAPFDLSRPGLLRVTLLRLAGGERPEHALLWAIHHIVSDAWSNAVLLGEVAALYAAQPLPVLPIQYADFAVWQRQWLSGEALERQLAYWRGRLAGAPTMELPTDRPRPPVQSFRGATHRVTYGKPLLDGLTAVARKGDASLFMALLAAFDVLLCRLTGQEDVVSGSPVANRTRPELERLIGFFVNTLVLRTDASGDPPFTALLARAKEVSLGAFAHQDLPFERLVEELQPRRDLSRNALFQVMLNLLNAPPARVEVSEGLEMGTLPGGEGASLFDLQAYVTETPEGLRVAWEHNTDLFDRVTIERLSGHFETLLTGIVADPGQRISDLPLLAPAERDQIVSAWNDTAQDLGPPACLHDLFYEQAARTPDAPAVLWKDGETTYGDLARKADRLARRLLDRGVGPGDLVAILMDPSSDRIAAVLAVLRAGAAYVPLDPAYPADRLAFMLEDTGAALLLDQETVAAALEDPEEGEPVALPSTAPDDQAYVIYTSGSTGRPKGVVIRHAAALNTVRDVNRRFGVGPGDRVFAVSALSFDLSVYDLFGPLSVGGAVVLPEPSPTPNPAAWSAALARHDVTVWDSAPALLDLLVSSGVPLPDTLRLVLLSGDWIPVTLPGEIRRRVPGARVISLGGATEGSIWSILYPIGDVPPSWASIPYGRPMANQTFHVLEASGHPAPVGVVGDLHIGGIGVADGYHARPELTAEKFIPDPFADRPGARLYRTGDLGRRLADGTIEFLGRRDHQVKIRGFRIELGEIEAVLTAHSAIREAVVQARQEEGLGKSAGLSQARLVGYFVPESGAELDLTALRAHLATRLPEHMVPSALVPLGAIPLTPNGKVDRRALPAPEAGSDPETGFVSPRDGVEETIAALWRDLLKLDRVGVHDNFFSLGGHSLLATRVAAALRDAFGVEVPLRTLFEKPTVASLALAVAQLRLEQAGTTEAAHLLETLEGLSDEEVEALLAGEEEELEEV